MACEGMRTKLMGLIRAFGALLAALALIASPVAAPAKKTDSESSHSSAKKSSKKASSSKKSSSKKSASRKDKKASSKSASKKSTSRKSERSRSASRRDRREEVVRIAAPPAPKSPPYTAILISQKTGEVLFAHGPDMVVHPASITKMMTLYIAFEELEAGRLQLTDPVPFSVNATRQRPSRLGLGVGKSLPLDTVIRAIAVKSANDAAVALAEKIEGSEAAFAARMTRTARTLGMRNTQYVNASGLPNPGQLTSARDIAILSMRLLSRFPEHYHYFGTRNLSYASALITNHNHLLGKVDGVDGIKTGYTLDAGFTLAASAERKGSRLIAVVLGARSARTRDADVTRLLALGFDALDTRRQGGSFDIASAFHDTGEGMPLQFREGAQVEQGSNDQGSRASTPRREER